MSKKEYPSMYGSRFRVLSKELPFDSRFGNTTYPSVFGSYTEFPIGISCVMGSGNYASNNMYKSSNNKYYTTSLEVTYGGVPTATLTLLPNNTQYVLNQSVFSKRFFMWHGSYSQSEGNFGDPGYIIQNMEGLKSLYSVPYYNKFTFINLPDGFELHYIKSNLFSEDIENGIYFGDTNTALYAGKYYASFGFINSTTKEKIIRTCVVEDTTVDSREFVWKVMDANFYYDFSVDNHIFYRNAVFDGNEFIPLPNADMKIVGKESEVYLFAKSIGGYTTEMYMTSDLIKYEKVGEFISENACRPYAYAYGILYGYSGQAESGEPYFGHEIDHYIQVDEVIPDFYDKIRIYEQSAQA